MSSTETPMNSVMSDLITHGKKLSCQLSQPIISREEVTEAINQILNSLSNLDKQLPVSFPRKVVKKILEKIQSTLQNFAKHDSVNAKEYGKLETTVNELKEKMFPDEQRHSESPAASAHDDISGFSQDYAESYTKLDDKKKKCLSLCLGLLPSDNNNDNEVSLVELSKRQLIHWWMGLNIIKSPKEGEEVLDKLVEEEFIIKRSSAFRSSSSSSSKYVMHTRSKVNQDIQFISKSETEWIPKLLSLVHATDAEVKNENIAVAINTGIDILNAGTCDKFSEMKDVEILHLGGWPYNTKKYVVVDDIVSLKNMTNNWQKITSLSFQGIAGIVELPATVYNLHTLKVLDLKACPNLEYLPQGINSLKNLTHLDVSECYLLNHIPKGAASLKELTVLKGFIINKPTKDHSNDQCTLNELSGLTKLEKLAIRARTLDFPTNQDLETLCKMHQLRKLKATWVTNKPRISQTDSTATVTANNESEPCMLSLPANLEKLELQAAPKKMALQLLDLIGCTSRNCPEKLCIRGGGLRKLETYKYSFLNVKTLRLRYLPKLHMKWSELQQLFPNLSHLEVHECPNLIFFPFGNNGQWNKSEQS